MKTTPLKDLRVFVGRAEAQLVALKLGLDHFDKTDDLMRQRIDTLQQTIRELRAQIDALA